MNGNEVIIGTMSGESFTAIAAVKSQEIQSQCETKEKAVSSVDGWKHFLTGRKEWSLNVNYLVLNNSSCNVEDVLKVGTTVALMMKDRDGEYQVTGNAIVTACRQSYQRGNLCQGSFSFKGTGMGESTPPTPPTPGRLPAGFTELAYIESSGTQYITIPISVAAGDFFGVGISFVNLTTVRGKALFSSDVSTQFRCATVSWNEDTSTITMGTTIGGSSGSGGWSAVYNELKNAKISTTEKNGTSWERSIASAFTSLNLLGSGMVAKVYSFKVYHLVDSIPVVDLVPAMRDSDSVVGMYDLVGNQFLTNAGTGTFDYGSL